MKNTILASLGVVGALGFGYLVVQWDSRGADTASLYQAEMFKSPFCGCCAEYAKHLQGLQYDIAITNTQELSSVKKEVGVPTSLESCHTMMIEGYVVEGHVPEEAIAKLLQDRPDIRGIGMAGMPSGSPGMPGPKEDFLIYEITKEGEQGDLFMIL